MEQFSEFEKPTKVVTKTDFSIRALGIRTGINLKNGEELTIGDTVKDTYTNKDYIVGYGYGMVSLYSKEYPHWERPTTAEYIKLHIKKTTRIERPIFHVTFKAFSNDKILKPYQFLIEEDEFEN